MSPGKTWSGLRARHGVRPGFVVARDEARNVRGAGIVAEGDRIEPATIDPQIENVEAVVVSDHVVKLLWLDASIEVDVAVENSLIVTQRIPDLLAGRVEEERFGARRGVEHGGGRGITAHQQVARRFVEEASGHEAEHLGLEAVGAGADPGRSGDMIVDPGGRTAGRPYRRPA